MIELSDRCFFPVHIHLNYLYLYKTLVTYTNYIVVHT